MGDNTMLLNLIFTSDRTQAKRREKEKVYRRSGGQFSAREALEWCVCQMEYDAKEEAKEIEQLTQSIVERMNQVWHNRLRTWLGFSYHLWTHDNALNRIFDLRRAQCDVEHECEGDALGIASHWNKHNKRVKLLHALVFGARHQGRVTLTAEDHRLLTHGRRLSKDPRMTLTLKD